MIRGLAAYTSSVSFGHPSLFFDSLDTQMFMSGFGDDDFSMRIKDVEDIVSLL